MGKCILIIQGHPDTSTSHLCQELANQYREGAESAGHEVRVVEVAQLTFPLLRSQHDWEHGELPDSLGQAQQAIRQTEHLVLLFPLWLGDMPALLKRFLEQIMRPGFAFDYEEGNPMGRKGLKGRSARVVVTMGMPALIYRHYFRAHSVKALERNILGFVGISPVRETLIGSVEAMSDKQRRQWFARLAALGRKGE